VIVLDGTHVLQVPSTGFPTATAGSTSWTDYKVSADVKADPGNGHARVIARYQSDQYFYACGIDHGGTLFLGKVYNGSWYTFATTPFGFTGQSWEHIDFSVKGDQLTCTATDPGTSATATVTATVGYFANGSVGATGESGGEFDNFVVTAL
jgi:hypothetical protein